MANNLEAIPYELLPLQPIGIGTPFVECLSSYVTRLARLHNVTVFSLVTRVILENVNDGKNLKRNNRGIYQGAWDGYRTRLDGHTETARNWLECIARLTQQPNLRALTMLAWSDALSEKNLIRPIQALCPVCLNEWIISYYPLLWRLKPVRLCTTHGVWLQEKCIYGDCGKTIPAFGTNPQVGFCPYCNRWQGLPHTDCEAIWCADQQGLEQRLVVQQLADLLKRAASIDEPPSREDLYRSLQAIANRITGGNWAALSRQLHLSRHRLDPLFIRSRLFPLDVLLSLSSDLGIPLAELLLEAGGYKYALGATQPNQRRKYSAEDIKHSLDAILASNEEPPLSLSRVAKRLSCSCKVLSKYCPIESSMIVKRAQKYRQAHGRSASHLPKWDPMSIRSHVEDLLRIARRPPLAFEVTRRVGCSVDFLKSHLPDLYTQIVQTYEEYQAQQHNRPTSLTTNGVHFGIEEIGKALQALVDSDVFPPPTIKELAIECGCTEGLIKYRFRELYRRIVDKRREFISRARYTPSWKRYSSDEIASKLTAVLASEATPPPSLNDVARHLGISTDTLTRHCPELTSAIVQRRYQYRRQKASRQTQRIIKFDPQKVESSLIAALREEPPPSLKEVSRRIGIEDTHMRVRFHELCKQVSARYLDYRAAKASERVDRTCREIAAYIRELHEQGIYPSYARIGARFGGQLWHPLKQEALRKAREELGYK